LLVVDVVASALFAGADRAAAGLVGVFRIAALARLADRLADRVAAGADLLHRTDRRRRGGGQRRRRIRAWRRGGACELLGAAARTFLVAQARQGLLPLLDRRLDPGLPLGLLA